MAKYWKSKTLLAKIETTYGTDAVPTGAANAILATEVTFSPMEGTDVPRNLERTYFAADDSVPAELRSVITFSVEMVGSGSPGVAPGWGPLLRACGVAEVITASTKVEYTPITDNIEAVTLYFDVDGTLQKMRGARGTVVINHGASGIPKLTFTMTGLFSTPVEAAKPTVSYSLFQAPQIGSTQNTPVFTIGGTAFAMRSYSLDLACEVQPRILIGQEAILITGKNERLSVTVEAVPVSTYSPVAIAQAKTPQAIDLQHGTVAGRKVQVNVPVGIQQRLSGYQENQGILEWPLVFSPQPTAGNDQWKITLT